MELEIKHYGTKRHSGRYPWGSGEDPYQHEGWFLSRVDELKRKGLTETEIAKALGMSTTEYRKEKSLARAQERNLIREKALSLRDQGYGYSEIGRTLGKNESTIRSILNEDRIKKQKITEVTADVIRSEVEKHKYVDIGVGNAENLGISKTRFDTAVKALENEGYKVYYLSVEQAGIAGQNTSVKVLCKPDVKWSEVNSNKDQIAIINQRFIDPNSIQLHTLKPVESISSKKIMVRYDEDGGGKKDGIIELRRGADGLSMGNSQYAQVRIGVDGTHFLKGVAVYSDNMPDGVDIVFNTSKKNTGNKLDAFKEMQTLPDGSIDDKNPFGATIKMGGQKGYLNIVNEEGDWRTWRKSLSSQMLSKQPVPLAKQQLSLAEESRLYEYQEIMSLENPTLRRHMLEQFAGKCDTAARHLDAAALPRQETKLILPVENIRPNEIYAPTFKQGETVVLIRHPHGGKFEIPELKVNNRNVEAKNTFGGAIDAVGIHYSVAKKLSGADFDGDTVIVIPNNSRKVKTARSLKGLADFDPKIYKNDSLPEMPNYTKQREMGVVSNLITDMTIRGASSEEIARAVRHSMVVIDAKKHHLDYKQSYVVEGIQELQKKYQPNPESSKGYGGASTLISRANAVIHVPERKMAYRPDAKTGEIIYVPTGRTYEKNGKTILATTKSKRMNEVRDAYQLSSGTAIESAYAEYANSMKRLANRARKDALSIKDIAYSKEAASQYSKEVESLKNKLSLAKMHAPYERKAQMVASQIVAAKKDANPDQAQNKDTVKKWKTQALAESRARISGKKPLVTFTDKEWKAVQSGAIHKTTLKDLLQYANQDQVKQLALPKSSKQMTTAKLSTAKHLLRIGYTQQEVATQLGVSVSTLQNALYS